MQKSGYFSATTLVQQKAKQFKKLAQAFNLIIF